MKKKYFILMIVALLSLTASAAKKQGTVSLTLTNASGSSSTLSAVAIFDDATHTATLGNGYNACISHYEEGTITIPGTCELEGVTYTLEVGPMAFRFCNWITAVNVSEGVKRIGDFAFVGCASLTSVRLPATLQSIGSGAFCELASLKTMTCYASTSPTWEWNDVFTAVGTQASMKTLASQRTLYVPESAYASYKDYQFDGTSTDAHERVGWQHAFKHIYGFSADPVTIGSAEELMAFRDAVNSGTAYKNSIEPYSVILTADIDLSSVSNWMPIGYSTGNEGRSFSGTFNGNGHVISGLKVDQNEILSDGLFGVTNDANIYHFHLLNPVISKAEYVGSVVGRASNTRISDVLVTSNASGSNFTVQANAHAGGIVGVSDASTTIERCMFRGRIKSMEVAGGIIGYGLNGLTITDCSADNYINIEATGSVKTAGGIAGLASQATITRCLARNEFANTTLKGAIIGELINLESSSTLTTDISSCAYWQNPSNLAPVGIRSGGKTYTETIANMPYESAASMIGDATSGTLGDGWHYFSADDHFYDYPIPETLTDMYLRDVKYVTDENGLVYRPYEDNTGVIGYIVVGYTGTAETLTIPDVFNGQGVMEIAAEVFKGNKTIKNITLGKWIAKIGDRAFYGSAIKTLNFGTYNYFIGVSAFEDCDSLQQVELSNSIRSIGARAFWNCDNLTSFGISYDLESHDGNFLAYCPKLSQLYLRSGVEKTRNNFYCLDNVLIHQDESTQTTHIVVCASGKTGNYTLLTQLGEGPVTYSHIHVMDDCFEGCSGLTGITFPTDKGYSLGARAFSGATNLRYIDMSGVTYFYKDGYIVHFDVDRQNEDCPFYNTSNSTIIYLPAGHSAQDDEPNVVIGGTAHRLLLTDGWDFTPPVDITATNGVSYDRTFTATPTEVTRPTGNKITVTNDETGETKEIDELVVTGYAFPPTGYSVCLPYALTITDDSIKVYEPTAITTPTGGNGQSLNVTFAEVTGKTLEPYKPYYITVRGDGEYNLNTTATTSVPRQPETTPWQSQNIEFKGTTTVISNAQLSADDSRPAYILQDDYNWHRVAANTEEAYVSTFRAYFQGTESNSALQLITLFDLRGDVNQDGYATIADVTMLVNIILGKSTAPESGLTDVNHDGRISIADVTALVNIILGKENTGTELGTEPGTDPGEISDDPATEPASVFRRRP